MLSDLVKLLIKCVLTLVSSLPQLTVAGRLLHQVQDGFGQRGVGQRVSLWVYLSFGLKTANNVLVVKTNYDCELIISKIH